MIRPVEISNILYMLAFLNVGLALFEDQIGLFDWNQKYIGKARFIDQRLIGSHKTYLFGSEKNVIASVASKDGSIVWRHVLEDGGMLVAMTRCDNVLLSVSVKGSAFIRAWDHRSGSIIWETLLSTSASSFDLWCDSFSEIVLFAHGSEVVALDLRSGKITSTKEQHPLSLAPQEVKLIASEPSDTHLSVIFLRSAALSAQTGVAQTELTATVISLPKFEQKDLVLGETRTYVFENLVRGLASCSALSPLAGQSHGLFLTCASVDPAGTGGFLKTVSLTGNQAGSEHIKPETMQISQSAAHIQRITPSRLLVTSSTGSGAVYELDASGRLVQKYLLKNAMLACLTSWNGRDFLFTAFQEVEQLFNNFALSVYDAQSGEPIGEFPTRQWTIAIHHGAVESINAVVFTDSTGLLSFRLLVQTEDQAIQVLRQNGKLQWIREEALADIVAVELVDLPVSESQARMEEEFGHTHGNLVEMFVKRFRTQAAQLWAYLNDCIAALPHLFGTLLSSSTSIKTTPAFADEDNPSANFGATVPPRLHLSFGSKLFESEHNPSLTSSDEASLVVDRTELSRPTIVNDLLTRDNFNLHKMIVVVTAVGKVFGLESNEGRLVWEHLVPSATVLANGKLALFQQRNTAHFPLPPITTALFRSKITNLPILYSFNPITGVPLHQPPADVFSMQSDIQQAVLMPGSIGEETDYVRPILMLDRNLQVHVYPPQYESSLNVDTPPLYLYTIEPKLALLAGYRVSSRLWSAPQSTDSRRTQSAGFYATRVWRMQLRSTVSSTESGRPHEIIAAASRPATEHIHSVGRVLGDRSVLYKYLNPNLLAVLTAGGDVALQTNTIMLYLIDVVAGRIVYSATHRRCTEPVNLVHSENWIVYTYYNHKSLRNEVTVLELFEPTTEGVGGRSELCAAFSVPGPAQLFLRNILPAGLLSSLTPTPPSSSERGGDQNEVWGPRALAGGSRSIFSSLYRTSEADGKCSATGADSLIPQVMQQSYILTTPPCNGVAAVSLTERGITSKSIVFGLQKGALIELPKSFFDPRRALDLSPELMEEGVHPYTPVLPLSDLAVISYNQSIMGIQAIRTAMTGLESTSLVFAYGLDLFFTRIAPSLTYDLLKEDFDYTAIAIVTLGMVVASVVTQRLAARRAVFRAWS